VGTAPRPVLARPVATPRAGGVGFPAAPRPAYRAAAGGKVVAIACSTGGPKALARLVPQLPSPLGAGGFIVQHMPAGFTASLASRLDRDSRLTVREATGGEQLQPGTLLMAPGGSHLRFDGERARLSDDAPVGALRPRADLSIVDIAKRYGPRTVLVVLTGMGKDGLEGAREVRRQGGRILVEDESTCTVYGMPRAVSEANLADGELALHDLPQAIASECA
jgi:two-component system chemotaxis response regulator CheB